MAKGEASLLIKLKDSVSGALKKAEGGLKGFAASAKNAGKSFVEEFSKRLVITAGDVMNAIKSVGGAIIDMATKAAEFKTVERAFANMAAANGKDAKAVLTNMRQLSGGTLSDLELMKEANKAILLGIPMEKFGEMTAIARSAAQATGKSTQEMMEAISKGIATGSKGDLEKLGIMFNLQDAYKKYAGEVGKSVEALTDADKRHAMLNETLRIGSDNLKNAGGHTETFVDAKARLAASFENAAVAIGKEFAPMLSSLANMFSSVAQGISDNNEAMQQFRFHFAGLKVFASLIYNSLIAPLKLVGGTIAIIAGAAVELLSGNLTGAMDAWAKGSDRVVADIKQDFVDWKDSAVTTYEEVQKKNAGLNENLIISNKEKNDKIAADNAEAAAKATEDAAAARETKRIAEEAERQAELDAMVVQDEAKIIRQAAFDQIMADQKLAAQVKFLNQQEKNETDALKKLAIRKQKEDILNKKMDEIKQKDMTAMEAFEAFINSKKVQGAKQALGTIAGLQSSSSKELVTIGKAAAIANITINTAEGVSKAWALGPFIGPPLAVLVGIAGAAQAAQVAGVAMADGGIVMPTSGGTQAIIGEAGRSEAVIPLPDDFDPDNGLGGVGGGGGVTINIGNFLGDESAMRDFAKILDTQLFQLRKSNESVAFDQGLI